MRGCCREVFGDLRQLGFDEIAAGGTQLIEGEGDIQSVFDSEVAGVAPVFVGVIERAGFRQLYTGAGGVWH